MIHFVTLMIYNKAYKDVRPLSMELIQEVKHKRDISKLYIGKILKPSGRWAIKFTYERLGYTKINTDYIIFNSYSDAQKWYELIWHNVFINKINNITPPPPPPVDPQKPKKSQLHLV